MTDYHQPDFYRFNEDSLSLVQEIISLNLGPKNILDIGAGSGVIGIELAQNLNIPTVHFLELQKEWEPTLNANIQMYLQNADVSIFWSSVGKWAPLIKYDLIVSNPPYYLPENGRISPDPVRARCRSFLEDDWEILLLKSVTALRSGGNAFFVTALENYDHVMNAGRNLQMQIKQKNKILIVRISSE